ncbi:MAG TPA: DsbE family thiol:disulfide interchange protein [Usitatibacteraceae bacterium]|nr:DsbE family thiol:disulfide interchange protein [Usitatibacteraceae bacterium]
MGGLKNAWKYFLPLAIFLGLLWFFYKGLSLDPRKIPSALLEKPAPQFALPQLHAPDKKLTTADMKGKVWLLNVWGSWCVSCRYEHPFLNDLAKKGVVPIIGLNWKDQPDAAKSWLQKFGDPYQLSVMDLDGRVAIDFGVYGAPETFVIDKNGIIRYKFTGPINGDTVKDTLLPLIQQLNRG